MTASVLTRANGRAFPCPAPVIEASGPVSPWPRADVQPTPDGRGLFHVVVVARDVAAAPSRVAPSRRARPLSGILAGVAGLWRAVTGDRLITLAMTVNVAVVAVDAAIVSYSHIYDLATGAPGSGTETGIQPHLLPLSIDGVIAEASLVMLFAARHKVTVPKLAWVMMLLGITATVAANVAHGLPSSLLSSTTHDVISALLSAWPAGAFIGSIELAMQLVRATRDVADDDQDGDAGHDVSAQERPRPAARTAASPKGRPAASGAPSATPAGDAGKADPVVAAITSHDTWKTGGRLTRAHKDEIAAVAGVTRRSVERCLKDPKRMSGGER